MTAGLAAISMVLNALWLLVTQAGWLEVSVVVIVALLLVLGLLLGRLHDRPGDGWVEWVVVDGTFGLYLGWVCVAVCANIAAALVARGVPATGWPSVAATLIVLLVVIGVGALVTDAYPGNYFVGVGITWGLVWVGVGRMTDEPRSLIVGVVALFAAATVLAMTWRSARPAKRPIPVPE